MGGVLGIDVSGRRGPGIPQPRDDDDGGQLVGGSGSGGGAVGTIGSGLLMGDGKVRVLKREDIGAV